MRLLSRLLLCLLLTMAGAAVALGQTTSGPEVRIRVGEHAAYDRVVFDWPSKPKYKIVTRSGSLVIFFDRMASFDLSRFQADPPPLVRSITSAPSESGVAVRLIVPPGVRVKHFPLDNKVVVDIYRPAPGQKAQKQPAAPKAKPAPSVAAPAAKPKATPQSKTAKPAPKPSAPAKQTAMTPAKPPEPKQPRSSPSTTDPRVSIGPNLSTLGAGLEAGYRFNDFLGMRLGGNYFSAGYDFESDDVDYDGDINWASAGAVLDLYPMGGGFRISGGLRYNGNGIDVEASPNNNVEIGGQTFTPSEVGDLNGSVDFWPVAPYVGIGYQAVFFDGRFGLGFDLGVLYQGKPDAELEADGTLGNNSTLKRRLKDEEKEIEDEIDFLGFYPVLGLSGVLRF